MKNKRPAGSYSATRLPGLLLGLCLGLMPVSVLGENEAYTSRQLDGGTLYRDFGGVSFGGYSGNENWQLGGSLDQDFSFGRISGSANQVIVPSEEICLLGRCWDTPEITADTRSGVKMSGNIGGYAHVGTDFGWQSGGFDAQVAAGLAGVVTLPERTYAYDSFRPTASLDWTNLSQVDLTLPGVEFDPYFGLGAHFDARVTGALPALGVHGFDLPTIDFDLPRLGFELPEFGLPDFDLPDVDSPFDFNNNRDDVAQEYKIRAGLTEVASIQRLRILNEKFIKEVNNKKAALLGLQSDLNGVLGILNDGPTKDQAGAMAKTLGDWVVTGQKKAAPTTAMNLVLQRQDTREAFVTQLENGLAEAANVASGAAKAKLEQTKGRLKTVMSGFTEEVFTNNVQTESLIAGNRIEGSVRWDMVDFDLDLDGLAALVSPIRTQLAASRHLGPLGNLQASLDVLDFKMGPKFGLLAEFSSELKETGYTWSADRSVVVADSTGITIDDSFRTNHGEDTIVQLLGADAVGFNVKLDGLREESRFGLDLIISDLGTLEMEALGDFELRFTSGLGKRINKVLPRWDESVYAGQFPLAEFEFAMDLFETSGSREIALDLDLGNTTLTPERRPVVPLLVDLGSLAGSRLGSPDFDGNVAPEYVDVSQALRDAEDASGANHGGIPSEIAANLLEMDLRTQTVNRDPGLLDETWGVGQGMRATDGIGSLWESIGADMRQLVVAYRNDYMDADGPLRPMTLWVHDSVDHSSDQVLSSLKVIEGSHLRLEPVDRQASNFQIDQELHTAFVENDGLISMVGEVQPDLDGWHGSYHSVLLQGVKDQDSGLTSIVIEGSGEIAMQGWAQIGSVKPRFSGGWEGNDTLFNVAGHRISGKHAVSDARIPTGFGIVASDDGTLAGVGAKNAPALVATGLVYNEGEIVATGHGTPDEHADLVVYSFDNLFNGGLLGSEGGNLAVHAGGDIESSGRITAHGGRVDIGNSVIVTQGRALAAGAAPSGSLLSTGLIGAYQGGAVKIGVNDFTNAGGLIEADGGGSVGIFGTHSTLLADGSVFLADGAGSRIEVGGQAQTDGNSGVIGVNAFDGAHLVLNGLRRANADDQTRVLFDLDDSTLELAGGLFDTRNYLLRSTGTIQLHENVSADFVYVPNEVTELEGQTVVDIDMGRLLVADNAHLGFELIDQADSTPLGDDILVRNNNAYTEVQGSGSISFLEQMAQLSGQLALRDGAQVQTRGGLTLVEGDGAAVSLSGNSQLGVGGNLALEAGTAIRQSAQPGEVSRLDVSGGQVDINGATLVVGASNLLNQGLLSGDWRVSEVLNDDGSHTAAFVDLSGRVEAIDGSLLLQGRNAQFAGLEFLSNVRLGAELKLDGSELLLNQGLQNDGVVTLDGTRLASGGRFIGGVGSLTSIDGSSVLEASSADLYGEMVLGGGSLILSEPSDEANNTAGKLTIGRGARLQSDGRIVARIVTNGELQVGGEDTFGRLLINGGLSFPEPQVPALGSGSVLPEAVDGYTVDDVAPYLTVAKGVVPNLVATPPAGSLSLDIGGTAEGEYDRLDIFGSLSLTGVLGSDSRIRSAVGGVHQSILNLVLGDGVGYGNWGQLMLVSISGFSGAPGDEGEREGFFDLVNITWNGTTHILTDMVWYRDRVDLGAYYGGRLWLDYYGGDGNDIVLSVAEIPLPGTLLLIVSMLGAWRLFLSRGTGCAPQSIFGVRVSGRSC